MPRIEMILAFGLALLEYFDYYIYLIISAYVMLAAEIPCSIGVGAICLIYMPPNDSAFLLYCYRYDIVTRCRRRPPLC